MMTSIYSSCSTWQGPASVRQCDFPVKGISHRVYLCVHMHPPMCMRLLEPQIMLSTAADQRREKAGGAATSLITKQTTTGPLFYTINSCRPLKGCYCETFLFSFSLQLNVTSTNFLARLLVYKDLHTSIFALFSNTFYSMWSAVKRNWVANYPFDEC